jgi:hypothetical protein
METERETPVPHRTCRENPEGLGAVARLFSHRNRSRQLDPIGGMPGRRSRLDAAGPATSRRSSDREGGRRAHADPIRSSGSVICDAIILGFESLRDRVFTGLAVLPANRPVPGSTPGPRIDMGFRPALSRTERPGHSASRLRCLRHRLAKRASTSPERERRDPRVCSHAGVPLLPARSASDGIRGRAPTRASPTYQPGARATGSAGVPPRGRPPLTSPERERRDPRACSHAGDSGW